MKIPHDHKMLQTPQLIFEVSSNNQNKHTQNLNSSHASLHMFSNKIKNNNSVIL